MNEGLRGISYSNKVSRHMHQLLKITIKFELALWNTKYHLRSEWYGAEKEIFTK